MSINKSSVDDIMAEVVKDKLAYDFADENIEYVTFESNTLKYKASKKKMPENLEKEVKATIKGDYDFKVATSIVNDERRLEYLEANNVSDEIHEEVNSTIDNYYKAVRREMAKKLYDSTYKTNINSKIDELLNNEHDGILKDSRSRDEIIEDVGQFNILITVEQLDDLLYSNKELSGLAKESGDLS